MRGLEPPRLAMGPAKESLATLTKALPATTHGPVSSFMGLTITKDPLVTIISQQHVALDLVYRTDMTRSDAARTPIILSNTLPAHHGIPTTRNLRCFREIVLALDLLARWTRPELRLTADRLRQHLMNPGPLHGRRG